MNNLLDENTIWENKIWDAIVIGAGPAGSTIANLLARSGKSVLLIDKSEFPRSKVCGSCLSGNAVETLKRLELMDCIADAIPVNEFHLGYRNRQCKLRTNGGKTISRRLLDQRLVNSAIDSGAKFLSGWVASLTEIHAEYREVSIRNESALHLLKGRIICTCGGLNQQIPFTDRSSSVTIDAHPKIGVSTTIAGDQCYPPGIISMATGKSGYVGIVQLESGQLDLAAAIKLKAARETGSVSLVVQRLISEAGFSLPSDFMSADWQGTVPLTRQRRKVSSERLFVLGDAAGYVEPFTGEGMSWAFQGAESLFPIAEQAIQQWKPEYEIQWDQVYRQTVRQKQFTCRIVKKLMNSAWSLNLMIPALQHFPRLANPFLNAIHGSNRVLV